MLSCSKKENIACDNFTARENAAAGNLLCQKLLIVRENASRLDLYAKENIACDNFTARENAACREKAYRSLLKTLFIECFSFKSLAKASCDNFTAKERTQLADV